MVSKKYSIAEISEKETKFIVLGVKLSDLLEKELAFSRLYEVCNFALTNRNEKTVFLDSAYCRTGRFRFVHGYSNSKIVQQQAIYFCTFYNLLFKNYFEGALNVHPSIESLLENVSDILEADLGSDCFGFSPYINRYKTKMSSLDYADTLNEFDWSYGDFVISAVLHNLEYFYYKNFLDEKKIGTSSGNLSRLTYFAEEVFPLLTDKRFGKELFDVLKETNIFDIYPQCWLNGFLLALKSSEIYEQLNRSYFYKQYCTSVNRNFRFF